MIFYVLFCSATQHHIVQKWFSFIDFTILFSWKSMENSRLLHAFILLVEVVVLVEIFIVDFPFVWDKIPPSRRSYGSGDKCPKDVDLDLKNTTKSDLLKAFLVMAWQKDFLLNRNFSRLISNLIKLSVLLFYLSDIPFFHFQLRSVKKAQRRFFRQAIDKKLELERA